MVDVAIALAIVLGAVAGWRKGFVVPLVAQAGALLGLATLFAGPLSSAIPTGTLGLLAGFGALAVGGSVLGAVASFLTGLVYRFTAVRRVDQVLGIPLGAVTAAISMYVALLATLTLDGWLDPLHRTSVLNAKDIQALQQIVAANPAAGAFADPAALQALAATAARAPVQVDDLGKYAAVLAFYEKMLRPQLLASRLAPLLLAVGEPLPVIGRHVDFPTR